VPRAGTGGTRVLADFDDNGKDDLVVGISSEDDAVFGSSGAIQIFYGGGSGGIPTASSEVITQDDIPATDGNESGDVFGSSLASGDFDNDGFPDLAVGAPGETVAQSGEGAVVVLFGSPTGLETSDAQFFTQDDFGVGDGGEAGDSFGQTLAAGKFSTGGTFDLAIGIPLEDDELFTNPPVEDAGAVVVVYGSGDGLDLTNSNVLNQRESQVEGRPESEDQMGSTLAAGNLGRSDQWDLAIGVRNETVNSSMAGAVHVIYGSNVNLLGSPRNGAYPFEDEFWTQASPGVANFPEDPDLFSLGLFIGDVGRSNKADLLIGAPGEGTRTADLSGILHVLYGANSGVTSKGAQTFTQATAGVPDSPQVVDLFGFTIAAADFDGDGDNDVAVGSPGESFGSGATAANLAGQVTILGSGTNGPVGAGSKLWSQNSSGIPDSAESGDSFAMSLATGNYARSSHDDLAIGTLETLNDGEVDEIPLAGAVHVLFGTATGLQSTNDQFLTENCSGCPGEAEEEDRFGNPLG
jgi:hypothetical protein